MTAEIKIAIAIAHIGIGVLIPDVGVVIVHPTTVIGIVLPIHRVAIIYIHAPVDVNIAAVPIEIVVPDGVADCPARTPSDATGDGTADHPPRSWRIVVRRVRRIRPRAIHGRRIVVGHINCFRLRRLDHDRLRAATAPTSTALLNLHRLLFSGFQ
jgi:hypothetical protein